MKPMTTCHSCQCEPHDPRCIVVREQTRRHATAKEQREERERVCIQGAMADSFNSHESEADRVEFTNSREDLPPGPWMDEPDEIFWTSSGLPCCMLRNGGFAWCGYVGVSRKLYAAARGFEGKLEAHGDVNYALVWGGEIPFKWAVALPNVDWKDTQWVGFDCSHLGDLAPKWRPKADDVYRDKEYVIGQVEQLAAQVRVELEALRLTAWFKIEQMDGTIGLVVKFHEKGGLPSPENLKGERVLEALQRAIRDLRSSKDSMDAFEAGLLTTRL